MSGGYHLWRLDRCLARNCQNPHRARGMCRVHFMRDINGAEDDNAHDPLDAITYRRERGRISDTQLARAFGMALAVGAPDHLFPLALELFCMTEGDGR